MSDDDMEPGDPLEQREAEALARALERGHADDLLPEGAFQTAALLRHASDAGALAPERADAVLGEVLEGLDAARAPETSGARSAGRLWRWLFGAGGLAVAAALVLWWIRPAPVATALPAPSAALLSAQIGRLSGDDEGYDGAMQEYRRGVYGALEGRYEAR